MTPALPTIATVRRTTASVVALLLLSSCTGTKMVQVWRDPKYQAQPIKRAFVLVAMSNDRARVAFENAVAQALTNRGIPTATSTGVFLYAEIDREKAERWVRENNVDLVLVLRMKKTTELSYMPGTIDYVPASVYYAGWWGPYGAGDGFSYTTAYMEEDTTVTTETTVYSAHSDPEKLVWSGASNTINVQDAESAAKSLASTLVGDLVKAGILPGK